MNENDDMAWHMVNFLKTLSDQAKQCIDDNKNTLFVPIFPSKPLDQVKIRTLHSVIEEF